MFVIIVKIRPIRLTSEFVDLGRHYARAASLLERNSNTTDAFEFSVVAWHHSPFETVNESIRTIIAATFAVFCLQ